MYNEEDVLNIPTEENVADEEVGHLVDEEEVHILSLFFLKITFTCTCVPVNTDAYYV